MSWLATKYAWKCDHERVKGGTRLVLLALALRVRYRRITTRPTSMAMLKKLTFLSEEQIRRCVDALEAVKEVRRLHRGKRATYAFPKMAGPLFVVEWDEEPVKMTDFSFPERKPEKPVKMTGFPLPMTGNARPSSRRALLSSSTYQVLSTSTPDEDEGAVEAFLSWFIGEYQKHRGTLYRETSPSKAEAAVRQLLTAFGADASRAMAIAMWSYPIGTWIGDSTQSVHVLLHKATELHAKAAAVTRTARADTYDPTERCSHSPKCLNAWECQRLSREATG